MKNRCWKHGWLAAGFCLIFILGRSQKIDEAIDAYAALYSPERAYLHYDKSYYSAGETIWFKAYLMNEIYPATESKTLYVDWIDDKGLLMHHTVSPILEAASAGQFDIPADYKGKLIHVRAYTRWMLNFDSAFIYQKAIHIITREPEKSGSGSAAVPVISFFPEGGDMVSGLRNKIAFKANDQWGRPVRVKGVVLNSRGKTEDSIVTQHDGMGFFYLTPLPGLSYTARWKDEKGNERSTALPESKPEGATLNISPAGNTLLFTVTCSPGFMKKMDTVHLVGTVYQHRAFRIARSTAEPIQGTIPTSDLPSGILTITLFDKNWLPLAERITYVNNEEYFFKPEMEVNRWGLNKRARNELLITVPPGLEANMSIAVTDAAIGIDSNANNIISHLMLSSELKGDIHNASYYFSDRTGEKDKHLDLVMLTHGWRRFKWDEIIAGNIRKPLYEKDTSYLTLSGRVIGVLPGQFSREASVVLMVRQKDAEGKMILSPIEPDGTFNDPQTILFDSAQVFYQFQKAPNLSGASIQFMTKRLPAPAINSSVYLRSFPPATDTSGNYRQFRLADEATGLAELTRVKTLENVVIKSRGKSPVELLDEKYASGLFSGGDGYQFDLVNDPLAAGPINIFTYLQGKVAGLQINTSGGTPSLSWRGGPPQLYLDQVPTDASFISSLNVNDVAFIKVFRPPFMGSGFNSANGAISIYTRKGGDVKQEPGKGLASNKIFGYSPIREFYSPNYARFTVENEQRDLRTTLYWNPALITTARGNQLLVTFYNNDVSESFRVVIEGMTRDGKLAHFEQLME